MAGYGVRVQGHAWIARLASAVYPSTDREALIETGWPVPQSRCLLLQHRPIPPTPRHNQIALLRLFIPNAVNCPHDCSQRADGLRDSRPVRPGLEFGERNP